MLFADPSRTAPGVTHLAEELSRISVDAVCGPLRGGAILAYALAVRLGCEFWFVEPSKSEQDGLFRATYSLPRAMKERVAGKRVALVDDVMSAGSSLRATHAELIEHDAIPVAVGALVVLGDRGAAYFRACGLPLVAPARDTFATWEPSGCPLCSANSPLENP
jgi:orotate phosphoribosyltransferase